MIWAALLLVVALAAPAVWAWYVSGRQLAVTTEAQQWRLLRHAVMVSAGVGAAILAVGAVAFVLTGYDWLVLALVLGYCISACLPGCFAGLRRGPAGQALSAETAWSAPVLPIDTGSCRGRSVIG